MCLPIEIGRDADGGVAPVEEVNINHCNHNNDENEIRFFAQCSGVWIKLANQREVC